MPHKTVAGALYDPRLLGSAMTGPNTKIENMIRKRFDSKVGTRATIRGCVRMVVLLLLTEPLIKSCPAL